MAEKTNLKIEREYVIPLREKIRSVPIYKKTPKAVKTVKEFVAKHMRVKDRDLKKVKLDSYLNEALWFRGIRKPINKIKVKVVKDGDIVRVYAMDLPSKINYKKLREEKVSQEQKKIGEKAKKEIEERKKAEEEAELKDSEDIDSDGVNDKVEEKEKIKANEEISQKEMKVEARAKKTVPKKGKEKIAEKKSQDRTSQGK